LKPENTKAENGAAQPLCENCKHAAPLEFAPGRPVGYYACALQDAWRFRVVCNNGRWVQSTSQNNLMANT